MRIDPKIKLIIWEMYDVSLSLSIVISRFIHLKCARRR